MVFLKEFWNFLEYFEKLSLNKTADEIACKITEHAKSFCIKFNLDRESLEKGLTLFAPWVILHAFFVVC